MARLHYTGKVVVQIEKTYEYAGNFGIVFHVSQLVVMPDDRARLRELYISEAKGAHYQVNTMLVALYDRMQAGKRVCEMKVAISQPLNRRQADKLNDQRTYTSGTVGSTAGGPVGLLTKAIVGTAVTAITAYLAKRRLPTHHAGDVIISIQASVSGGTGTQQSSVSTIIKNQG
ncbi:hypothetical protein [Pseudomonas wadenswilerensis]|uniref:hypothetical protein n=1 Tax=Pseudomonas wadenswilerensis TaxID=1785161 RepID=UPI002160274C|nr:hypothetical protein [Pseudomonas wadenswilerensis]UVM20227.1 hypothetical protein LOY45_17420 [Pseudomonas wadenswilerensis]